MAPPTRRFVTNMLRQIMNSFDSAILAFLTQNALHSVTFSHAVSIVADYYLFKGVLPLAMLCAIWFDTRERRQWQREMVVATILSGLLALFIGRVLAHYLPFRQRPLYDHSLHLMFPVAATPEAVLPGPEHQILDSGVSWSNSNK
jgi:hypothetical protein